MTKIKEKNLCLLFKAENYALYDTTTKDFY